MVRDRNRLWQKPPLPGATARNHRNARRGGACSVRRIFRNMESSSESGMQLMNALGDPDWRVRRKAVDALLRHGEEGCLADFIRKFRGEHRDPAVLNSILQILVS